MPHTDSAKKRNKQNQKRRARNRAVRSEIKTDTKQFLELVKAKKIAEAKTQLAKVTRRLDKAGSRRYVHPNQAARHKSRLTRLLHKSEAAG